MVSFSILRPFGPFPVSATLVPQVTQDQFWQLTCDLSTPGTQPYALCGLTTCSGLEEYPDVAACKCAPETVNEMFEGASTRVRRFRRTRVHQTMSGVVSLSSLTWNNAGTPMESTFRMGSSTIYLSQSETYRNAVAAQYAGTLDLPAFCTALTDGTICEESGLGCDFISFHTGATNEECRRKALAKGESHSEATTHIQSHDSNAGFAWEIGRRAHLGVPSCGAFTPSTRVHRTMPWVVSLSILVGRIRDASSAVS